MTMPCWVWWEQVTGSSPHSREGSHKGMSTKRHQWGPSPRLPTTPHFQFYTKIEAMARELSHLFIHRHHPTTLTTCGNRDVPSHLWFGSHLDPSSWDTFKMDYPSFVTQPASQFNWVFLTSSSVYSWLFSETDQQKHKPNQLNPHIFSFQHINFSSWLKSPNTLVLSPKKLPVVTFNPFQCRFSRIT